MVFYICQRRRCEAVTTPVTPHYKKKSSLDTRAMEDLGLYSVGVLDECHHPTSSEVLTFFNELKEIEKI